MGGKSKGKRGGTIMKDAGQVGSNLGKGMKKWGREIKRVFSMNEDKSKKKPHTPKRKSAKMGEWK